jgi:cbb3-type cytochrome oxidase maturation protein
MSVVVLLIVAGGVVAAGFLAAFAWAVQSGQYDDTCTPAVRVLLEDRTNGRQEDGRDLPASLFPPTRLPVFPASRPRNKEGLSHVDVDH